jgi:hypothetical protein
MTFREDVRNDGLRQAISKLADERFRAIMAGISLDELRALFRGDDITERPNP